MLFQLSLGYRKNFFLPLAWKALVSDIRRGGRVGTKFLIVLFHFEIRNILLTKIKTESSVFQSFYGQWKKMAQKN